LNGQFGSGVAKENSIAGQQVVSEEPPQCWVNLLLGQISLFREISKGQCRGRKIRKKIKDEKIFTKN